MYSLSFSLSHTHTQNTSRTEPIRPTNSQCCSSRLRCTQTHRHTLSLSLTYTHIHTLTHTHTHTLSHSRTHTLSLSSSLSSSFSERFWDVELCIVCGVCGVCGVSGVCVAFKIEAVDCMPFKKYTCVRVRERKRDCV